MVRHALILCRRARDVKRLRETTCECGAHVGESREQTIDTVEREAHARDGRSVLVATLDADRDVIAGQAYGRERSIEAVHEGVLGAAATVAHVRSKTDDASPIFPEGLKLRMVQSA
jgi:hypothetical protein